MVVIFQSILWLIFGIIIYREKVVTSNTPSLLGRILYWIGMPLQIFYLARQSDFADIAWLPPIVMVMALLSGLGTCLLILRLFKQLLPSDHVRIMLSHPSESSAIVKVESDALTVRMRVYQDLSLPKTRKEVGGFILASILGNTGFIGLALIPPLISQSYWSWVVLYGVAHNILGSYGLGVLVADYYSPSVQKKNWRQQLYKLLFLPSLWAFAYGYTSRELSLPSFIDIAIEKAVLLLIPGAFVLIGMELSKLQQWQNLRSGIFPTLVKMLIIPGIVGLGLTILGISGDKRLVLVLMSSMPTAFASVILSEAYNLDRNVAASSILLSTLSLPIVLSLWLVIF